MEASQDKQAPSSDAFVKYKQAIPETNVKFEMLPLPGGTYLQGSPEKEKDRNPDEGPQTKVEIKPFWMGKCEVTWDEYDQFIYQKPPPKPARKGEQEFDAVDIVTELINRAERSLEKSVAEGPGKSAALTAAMTAAAVA